MHVPESQITLGKLLEYEPIENLLGINLISILTYELHQIVDSENKATKVIGMNLRNKLMHNNNSYGTNSAFISYFSNNHSSARNDCN